MMDLTLGNSETETFEMTKTDAMADSPIDLDETVITSPEVDRQSPTLAESSAANNKRQRRR